MNETVRIDCGICADLLPLVEDGVACEQSRRAVREHMSACADCRGKYGAPEAEDRAAQDNGKDDARIIGRVRERISGWMLAGTMLSLILGVMIAAMSEIGLYLIPLIFPVICGAVYLRGSRLWKWVPLMAMACWAIVTLLMSGSGDLSEVPLAFMLALIPLGLSYVGALAAALMKYAVKGGTLVKTLGRVLAGVLGGMLVLSLLVVSLGLSGDPLSEKQAARRAVAYAERIYPGQTFTVKDITRDRPFSYRAEVQSVESEDTRFSVTTDFWVRTSDMDSHGNADHVLLVEEKWNTRYRLGKTAAKRAAAIFEVELPEIRINPLYGVDQDTAFVDLCCLEEEWERYKGELTIDMPFDAALLNKMPACLTAVVLKDDDPAAEELQEILVRIRTAMEKHGMMFDFYEITLIRADGEGEVLNSGMIAAEEIGG